MTHRSFVLAATFVLSAGGAMAQVTADSVVADYQAQGFTRIEVRSGLSQMKVEAFRGTEKVEVILDKATGDILKRETGTADIFDNTTPGVSVRERNRDFIQTSSDDDDDDGDEDGSRRGRGGSDDDDGDDDRSSTSDDGSDDSGDDNGGNRSGSDDDGSNDDNGGNRNGSDDDDGDDGDDDNGGNRNGSDDGGDSSNDDSGSND